MSQVSSRDVATWRVDVPIEYLVIEKPFALGDVTLHFYDRSFWDDLEQGLRKTKSDVEATQVLERLRRDFQGRVIASSTSKGDLRKCIEVATLRTELAVTVLRFFSPAAFLSPLTARFGMKGKVQLPTTLAWAWKEDWWTSEHFLEDLRSPNWGISQQYLEQLGSLGLDQASDLIRSKQHTPFKETLLASIATFGRAVANSDFHDKLIFCLSSAETLLLPETSEPVQTTLGLRLARSRFGTINLRVAREFQPISAVPSGRMADRDSISATSNDWH